MTHFLYFLFAQAAAFCSWVAGSGAEMPAARKRNVRAAMSHDLYGPKPFTLVRGGKAP